MCVNDYAQLQYTKLSDDTNHYEEYINGNRQYGFEKFQYILFCVRIFKLKSKHFSFTEKLSVITFVIGK